MVQVIIAAPMSMLLLLLLLLVSLPLWLLWLCFLPTLSGAVAAHSSLREEHSEEIPLNAR